ncbi:MAG TPA: glycerol-3-phosphate 1-O-acyltransferase PlsY [Steroidobacteraceae bacterium]
MSELLIKILSSYLVGAVVGGLLVGRLRGGVDIRSLGSGNAGGTNALRTQGRVFAFWVLLIDIGKGWLTTHVIGSMWLSFVEPASPALRPWLPAACGIAGMAGHVYPIWFGFRGGKGVATLVGAVLGLDAWLLIPMLLVWYVAVVLVGFVGLASMAAAAALPVAVVLTRVQPYAPLLVFGIIATIAILYTHRGNVARMRSGTEPRARRLWLMGRRAHE